MNLKLKQLIEDNEEWLIDRVLGYAKTYGYTTYTSTLKKAWRASVRGLSAPLLQTLLDYNGVPKIHAEDDFFTHSIAQFGIQQAREHRERGISLGLFLGLIKYYRQTYLDLISENITYDREEREYRQYIQNFFNYVELGFCSEWSKEEDTDALQNMQSRNRSLTNEKNKYLTIFESMHDPVFLLDKNGTIENMNQAARQAFVGHKDPGDSYYSPAPPSILVLQIPELLSREKKSFEARLETLNGTCCFDVRIQPMLDFSERYSETVIILRDITETKKTSEALALANQAQSAFFATLTHEIRNPINGVLGMAELLNETALSSKQKHYVKSIASCSKLLLNVLNDTLDYSKFESGNIDLETIDFDLMELLDDFCTLPLAHAQVKNLPVRIKVAHDISAFYYGDPTRLQQILLNLVDNALKFTDTGDVVVQVHRRALREDGAHLLLFEVIDQGIGLKEDKVDLLFKPYVQQDSSTSRLYGGSGLGLAICDKLVKAMGGDIWAQNNLKKGATFSFQIPLKPAPALFMQNKPQNKPNDQRLKILLVEDNDVNKEVTEGFLMRCQHTVVSCASGEQALDHFDKDFFDLILMDVRMPGMGGMAAVREIRKRERLHNRHTQIIFLSAFGEREQLQTYFATGADAFLRKPFAPDDLFNLISECMRGKVSSLPRPETSPPKCSVMEGHLRELGRDRCQKIVNAFLKDAPNYLQSLRSAHEAESFIQIMENAHPLKSSASNVGVDEIAHLAGQIEDLAQKKDKAAMTSLIQELETGFPSWMSRFEENWKTMT